jgi:O-methyltransferase involved in polyketide biosynthesis
VQATAIAAAACRAEETRRPRPRLTDPLADLFTAQAGKATRSMVSSGLDEVIMRTHLIDVLLLAHLSRNPGETVVNLGAGYCTRPYRLDLSSCAGVVEVDAEALIQNKTTILTGYPASCPVRRIGGDVRSLPPLPHDGAVITEGLLVYLTPAELAALATTLATELTARVWLADIVSTESAQAMATLSGLPLSGLDSLAVFERAGWTVTDYRPLPVSRQPARRSPAGGPPASHTVVDGVLALSRK